jgi:hypothetical protein
MNQGLIADALFKTNQSLYYEVAGGSDFTNALKKKGARVFKYRSYERGDHDANLTEQQKHLLNIRNDDAKLNEASANYCSIVVDMMAGRLSVAAISAKDDTNEEWINDTLTRNNFESKQGEWNRGAIRDGESFVIVDPQTALWVSEPAYDGFSGIFAIYDTITGLPKWACKLWVETQPADISTDAGDTDDDDIVYLVVYEPRKITYWQGTSSTSEVKPRMINQTGILKVLESGNGYEWEIGIIPIVQFANKRNNYTNYGESEIRCVIPLQNIVNATLYDMMMASKLSAFKIYWSKGMKIKKDGIVPGSVINLTLQDGDGNDVVNLDENMIAFLNAVEVGEFGSTDMSQYTAQLDKLEREISQVSATPIYGITNQGALSGEALKQLEIGLINKVYRYQNENDRAFKMLFRLTALIQRTFEVNQAFEAKFTKSVADFVQLSAPVAAPQNIDSLNIEWKSPEIIDAATQIKTLSELRSTNPNLWSDNWYRQKIGSLLGMSNQQITEEGESAEDQKLSAFETITAGRSGNIPVA